jgi:tRNA-dihydrouridine synthase
VFNLKRLFPHLNFVINGGFSEIEKVVDILRPNHPGLEGFDSNGLEGCMSGRMAMNTPWEVARVDGEIYKDLDPIALTREEILRVS